MVAPVIAIAAETAIAIAAVAITGVRVLVAATVVEDAAMAQ